MSTSAGTEAYSDLYHELRDALRFGDPQRIVETPGFGLPGSPRVRQTARDVIADDIAGEPGVLADLLVMVGKLAAAGDAEALAWIDAAATRHAEFHADDMAIERADAAEEAMLESRHGADWDKREAA